MSATSMYFVSARDAKDGFELMMLIEAHSVAEALGLWCGHCHSTGVQAVSTPVCITRVPRLTGRAAVFEWDAALTDTVSLPEGRIA